MNILDEVNKLPKKDILSEHRESILIMRDKGYTWREVSDFFNKRGFDTDHTTIYKMMKRSNKMSKVNTYKKIQNIVEDNNGTFEYESEGSDGGTYHITINGHSEMYSSNGRGHIPELDGLYVPTKVNPTSWNDYKDELLSDGKEVFLSRFGL